MANLERVLECDPVGGSWGKLKYWTRRDGRGLQSIHGRCASCGYEIAWTLISSQGY